MQLGGGGEGGEAEAGLGGVLEVGAGVGEEDEGHGFLGVGLVERGGEGSDGVVGAAMWVGGWALAVVVGLRIGS